MKQEIKTMASHMIDGKEFIETAEATAIAGRSESHLRLLARNSAKKGHPGYGKLPCRKIFGRWAYDKEALIKLASGEVVEEASKDIENGTTDSTGGASTLDL